MTYPNLIILYIPYRSTAIICRNENKLTKLNICLFLFDIGVVSESSSKVAKDGKMLGKGLDYGRIWALWCNGSTFFARPRNNYQGLRKGGKCSPLALR